ncbi:MAG: type 2 isopentenyl-diphosphate Delta-isomerase [Alphaproteobacteria bacterium]|nr:type 2 isopentenyl-diphosphate Delta-isomerase [Alphaproteobacteria bacterium]
MTTTPEPKTADRKNIHLDLARGPQAQSQISSQFDRIELTHNALPELNFDDVSTACRFLGRRLSMPLIIGAMTGGTDRADAINLTLAKAANAAGVALAVGSQRASIEDGRPQKTIRQLAPDVPVIGNLGGVQLARPDGIDLAKRAVENLEADAIFIHLNPLQEIAQPEGDRDWRGVEAAIAEAVNQLDCPVIVKEVGAGLSASVAGRLKAAGVRMVDVAGIGGTNWTRIETLRREEHADPMTPFLDWGIPTLDAVMAIRDEHPDLQLIASGGIRHGLDAAKAIWLGAELVAAAGHFLRATENDDAQLTPERLASALADWRLQMQMTLFLTGSRDLAAFKRAEGVIDGG